MSGGNPLLNTMTKYRLMKVSATASMIVLGLAVLLGPRPLSAEEQSAANTDQCNQAPITVPGADKIGGKLAEYTLRQAFGVHAGEVIAYYGILSFAEVSENHELRLRVEERYRPYLTEEKKPGFGHVDANVFGIIPYKLAIMTANKEYLKVGQWLADTEYTWLRDDGLTRYARFWVDDIFMVCALQGAAYQATQNSLYADRCANFLCAYIPELQQPNGLFFHTKTSQFYWGRGNGWAAIGMIEALTTLPAAHPKRAVIHEAYVKLMDALLKHQSPDGMWRQLLDDPTSFVETSSSAMFIAALATGLKREWLKGETYEAAVHRGWRQLTSYIDDEGSLKETVVGMGRGVNKEHYLNQQRKSGDAHGQGAALLAAAAVLRLNGLPTAKPDEPEQPKTGKD